MCTDEIAASPRRAPAARYVKGIVGRSGKGLVAPGAAWTAGAGRGLGGAWMVRRGLVIQGGAWWRWARPGRQSWAGPGRR